MPRDFAASRIHEVLAQSNAVKMCLHESDCSQLQTHQLAYESAAWKRSSGVLRPIRGQFCGMIADGRDCSL